MTRKAQLKPESISIYCSEMTRKAQLKPRKQKGKRKRDDNMFKRHKSKRQIVPRRSSLAKKPRCEGSTSATTPTSSVAAAETDPRSIIKSYEYDPVDEKEYKPVGGFGQHGASEKEILEYWRQLEESDGFDVMHFPKTFFGFGAILPILDLREYADKLKSLSELALAQYNEEKQGSKLKFVKIVKANTAACAGHLYYITFDAKDASAGDGCTSTYQAEVWDGLFKPVVKLIRPKKQGD